MHCKNYNHNFNWDETIILDTQCNWNKRLISEMLHIKDNMSAINKKEDVAKLSTVYTPILNTIARRARVCLFF